MHDPIGVDLDQSLYALDSTTIDLCLSLFPWAKFRQRKSAVKMHTLLDLHGNIPTFIRVTSGDVHDVNILDEIMPEAGSFYVMDRAFIDFQRLFVFTLSSAFFVVRTKSNVLIQRRYSHAVDKSTGARSDQTVILTSFESATAYPVTPLGRSGARRLIAAECNEQPEMATKRDDTSWTTSWRCLTVFFRSRFSGLLMLRNQKWCVDITSVPPFGNKAAHLLSLNVDLPFATSLDHASLRNRDFVLAMHNTRPVSFDGVGFLFERRDTQLTLRSQRRANSSSE